MYGTDLAGSARRHLRAAQNLLEDNRPGDQPGCRAVAGYLFGLAGELALKEMMRQSGMRPLTPEERGDDPFFTHFPALKTLLKRSVQGRRAGEIRKIAENSQLFQCWDTNMRYAPTADIKAEWVSAWAGHAVTMIQKMSEF